MATITSLNSTDNGSVSRGVINTNFTNLNNDISAVLQTVYPVGSIYMATVSTNPATLFGFGTWSAYGAGRVPVGKASSGTFATAGATGGEETHTLSVSEMPIHNHSYNSQATVPAVSPDVNRFAFANGGAQLFGSTNTAGSGTAHNNLQPYIVTYMWQRVS